MSFVLGVQKVKAGARMAAEWSSGMLLKSVFVLTAAACITLAAVREVRGQGSFLFSEPNSTTPPSRPPSPSAAQNATKTAAAALESETYFTLECSWITESEGHTHTPFQIKRFIHAKETNYITADLKAGQFQWIGSQKESFHSLGERMLWLNKEGAWGDVYGRYYTDESINRASGVYRRERSLRYAQKFYVWTRVGSCNKTAFRPFNAKRF